MNRNLLMLIAGVAAYIGLPFVHAAFNEPVSRFFGALGLALVLDTIFYGKW